MTFVYNDVKFNTKSTTFFLLFMMAEASFTSEPQMVDSTVEVTCSCSVNTRGCL